jgi:hypothetical protein
MGVQLLTGDRVLQLTTTTGTGTYQLGAAAAATYRTLAQTGIASGSRVMYVVQDDPLAPTQWEECEGIYTTGSPNTLTRATVRGGSNGTSAVNWGAGTKYIYLSAFAKRLLLADNDGLPMAVQAIAGAWPSTNFDPSTSETIIFNVSIPARTRGIVGQVTVNGLTGASDATLTCPVYLLNASGGIQSGPINVPNRAKANSYGQANFPITFAIGAGLVGSSTAWALRFNAYRNNPFTMSEYTFNGLAICEPG